MFVMSKGLFFDISYVIGQRDVGAATRWACRSDAKCRNLISLDNEISALSRRFVSCSNWKIALVYAENKQFRKFARERRWILVRNDKNILIGTAAMVELPLGLI